MNASRVFGAFVAILGVVGVFSHTGQARAQEMPVPESAPEGVNYATGSLELLAPYVAGDGESSNLTFSVLLKNNAPDRQTYRLGVNFRDSTKKGADRLYIARVTESYAVAGKNAERVQFSVSTPRFLSGTYAVSIGATDEKGNMAGMINLADIRFSGADGAVLSECSFAEQSFEDGIRAQAGDAAKARVACKAAWSGEGEGTVNVAARLTDFRYAPTVEIGKTSVLLSKQTASVIVPLTKALPAGFYQLEIAPLDSNGQPVGAPVRTVIAVEGVGGKIVSIADTTVKEKDGQSVVPVSVLTETYDKGTYQVTLGLTSEGAACATPIKLSRDDSMNESRGEFVISKNCRYPVIMATLSDASGKKLDQAIRAFGERVPQVAKIPMSQDSDGMSSQSLMSWGLLGLFALPVLFVALWYIAKKKTPMKKMMPVLLFVAFSAAMFGGWTGKADAAYLGYYMNYFCFPDDPCPEATTIWKNYSVKDEFAPGESISVGEFIGSDDYPMTPTNGHVSFLINNQGSTGDLDPNTYQAQDLREGVFNNYTDDKLKAPMTPGTFTLTIPSSMSGYTGVWAKSVTLRVVEDCSPNGSLYSWNGLNWDDGGSPDWQPSDAGSGYSMSDQGPIISGPTELSSGIVATASSYPAKANLLTCGSSNVDVTMTGKAGKVGFWKGLFNSVEASGPAVNIASGQSALLTWTSVNATSCDLTTPLGTIYNVGTNRTDYPVSGLSAGTHILSIDCRNGSDTASDFVTVNVNSAPTAPTITGPGTGVTGTAYSYVLNATDPESDTLRYGYDNDGNGTVDSFQPSTGYVNSGTNQTVTRTWTTPGTYTIQAMAQDSKGMSSSFTPKTVVITNPTPAALNICPVSTTVNEGGSTQLRAWYTGTGTSFNGCSAPNGTDRTTSSAWSSSNSGVASVSSGGLLSGVTPGSATIGASYSGTSDTMPATVLCTPKDSCTSQTSKDKAELVCTSDTFDITDGCGNAITCNGTRACDYNWKEVAP